MKVELVMSEFGSVRQNAGSADLRNFPHLNPTLDSFLRVFPNASVTLYTDTECSVSNKVRVVKVDSPFDRSHPRFGWRSNDYFKVQGLLLSTADVAIAMDSDMLILDERFSTLARIAVKFSLAVPLNSRLLVGIDGLVGVDSPYRSEDDELKGLAMAYAMTPIAFSSASAEAREMLQRYCELMLNAPGRGPIKLFQAAYDTGFAPYVLPPQWCVCSPRDLDSRHIWPHAVVLHIGHSDVYPKWRREKLKRSVRSLFGKRAPNR